MSARLRRQLGISESPSPAGGAADATSVSGSNEPIHPLFVTMTTSDAQTAHKGTAASPLPFPMVLPDNAVLVSMPGFPTYPAASPPFGSYAPVQSAAMAPPAQGPSQAPPAVPSPAPTSASVEPPPAPAAAWLAQRRGTYMSLTERHYLLAQLRASLRADCRDDYYYEQFMLRQSHRQHDANTASPTASWKSARLNVPARASRGSNGSCGDALCLLRRTRL